MRILAASQVLPQDFIHGSQGQRISCRSVQGKFCGVKMGTSANFLHVTDAHLSFVGTPNKRDDRKREFVGFTAQTREVALADLFERLAEKLEDEQTPLDAVIFSGDAQDQGRPGGHEILRDLLLKHFAGAGITAQRIVAVPGNHDVDRDFAPSTPGRYSNFCKVWRDAGCVVPWLDGIDDDTSKVAHSLVADDASWAVFAINSSNWCHAATSLPHPLADVWDALPSLASDQPDVQRKIGEQLASLARFDMARISDPQLRMLRRLVSETPRPPHGRQLRIGVLHHHLRSPSLREEIKPFADMSNLEQVRAFFRDREFDLVLHGHKHEHAANFEHLYDNAGEHARRMLVISGATFDEARELDAVRLLKLTGLPFIPEVVITPIGLQRAGVDTASAPKTTRRLWTSHEIEGGPTVIQGTDLDEVYTRVVQIAGGESANGTLVVHLDLPATAKGRLPLPSTYPLSHRIDGDAERQRWLKELVEWWQLDRSKLEQRMPFVHGGRLRRYGGKVDQIKRIKRLLSVKQTTRALAVLIDPFRDFTEDGTNEEFASFTLVEFKRRDIGSGRCAIDAIAFYRTQEFAQWWPINVAELRFLQAEIADALSFTPGRITTITADARTRSRSPTQVAMPTIDRWLDQAPERIHALANVMVTGAVRNLNEQASLDGWWSCLSDLRATTLEFNPDGIPLAIEGLETLASYLRVTVQGDTSIDILVGALIRMAQDNRDYEVNAGDRDKFNLWAERTQKAVEQLEAMTKDRLRAE